MDHQGSSYYAVLGVRPDASSGEIRSAYRRLALKWHPDRWGREPWQVEEAKQRFQHIQEAYQVLSDQRKRSLYDSGLYSRLQDDGETEEEIEGFSQFLDEMLTLMAQVKREGKEYSLQELQRMLAEMVQDFNTPAAAASATATPHWVRQGGVPRRSSKRSRWDMDPSVRRKARVGMSGIIFGGMDFL